MQTLQEKSIKELRVLLTKEMISQVCQELFPTLTFTICEPKKEIEGKNAPMGFSCSVPLSEIGFVIWNFQISGRVKISSTWSWYETEEDMPETVYDLKEAIKKKVVDQMKEDTAQPSLSKVKESRNAFRP